MASKSESVTDRGEIALPDYSFEPFSQMIPGMVSNAVELKRQHDAAMEDVTRVMQERSAMSRSGRSVPDNYPTPVAIVMVNVLPIKEVMDSIVQDLDTYAQRIDGESWMSFVSEQAAIPIPNSSQDQK